MPADVRDQLGLVAGTEVEFRLGDGEVVLRKGSGSGDPVDRIYGRVALPAPVDTLVDAMRGPRPKTTAAPGARRGRRGRRPAA